jgi:hypothetical protein
MDTAGFTLSDHKRNVAIVRELLISQKETNLEIKKHCRKNWK